ncbi:uncharacterized protein FOMMEDRAFT_101037 [Fomitiporia mediterranea MF3/22]|uniref:uncharacterized protein n=1 Tax=Fomitiporia mediterranea (strain MF3/22) TaxID=694068 RepID=UPI0004408F39|nr:uncharacterized protein FOMMEDRAFT_101037 [Fomitiporia mediterranea MF3/22]EJD07670.1 hypothetical protein FOMMEDRAFT_101037 [Fomitiporia mediterranea MF3/22]
MTHDDADTCRICSAPAEPDAPLFHPCRCSGTIRYIHQDCLTTWLAHSKKKTCDVCKYQYSFTKVYSDNMPRQIPFILFLRKFAQKSFWACIMAIRGLMVATIWLAFLPYVTVWTWRFYFIMGENIAWWIYDHPRPSSTPIFHSYFSNLSLVDDQNRTNSPDKTIMGLVTSYPVWRALSADIFTGQIIASLIVLVFLGIFLLREWIIQNARPGVFDDDDAAGAGAQDGMEAGLEPAPAEVAEPAVPNEGEHAEDAAQQVVEESAPLVDVPGGSTLAVTENGATVHPGQKRRLSAVDDADREGDDDSRVSRVRSRIAGSSSTSLERQDQKDSEPVSEHGSSKGKGRSTSGEMNHNPDHFEFTFSVGKPAAAPNEPGVSQPFTFGPPPDSANLFHYTPSTRLPYPLTPGGGLSNEAESSSGPRRPPLPNTNFTSSAIIDLSDEPSTSMAAHPVLTDVDGPTGGVLPSPSLATYRAPEEFEANATSSAGSRTDAYEDDDSHKSDRGSISSSAIATVADSDFRNDLNEYFREENEMQGPIHVGEILNEEDVVEEPDQPAVEEGDNEPEDVAEEQDGINDDDVDGALEAVGMRGPLTTVFQNAALMIFVLDTTIGLAVWLPFTIGKTAALLSLEPARIAHLLQWPIRIIRFFTDPAVDLIALGIFNGGLPIRNFVETLSEYISPSRIPREERHFASQASNTSKVVLDSRRMTTFFVWEAGGQGSAIIRGMEYVANSPVGQFLEPYFARLGRRVRMNATSAKAGWIELANGDASINRFFAISLGYLLAGILLAFYLNVLNVGNVQSAGRAIRNAIRQQLIVLKVAIFILIELVVFPLGCGVMLDFCTLQLFPDATVRSRMSFFAYAPVTATFYHWMVGTMFMYQFAILLGGCRKILRPGGLWFIKDPQDQNFHPIRDILDRPTLLQMRKLAISAMMYSVVVALGMGGLVTCLHVWGRFLLPLRWKLREPLSDIPVDLLFLHIVMPSTIKYFRPRKLAFVLATKYWKFAARQLRITSYMFGGLHPEEMRPSKCILSWLSSLFGASNRDEMSTEDGNPPFDGSFRRVPAQDNISLPREIRATVVVDRDGNPLDEAGRRLMDLQNAEAEKAKRNASEDYAVVYLPPHFRERVIIFIVSLWIVGSSLFVAGLAIPTLLGRAVFSVVLGREVHDGYSIMLGFYLLWGCYFVGTVLDRMDKRRQRSNSDEPRGEYAVYVFKRAMLWSGNVVWVAFWIGVVIPTLLAVVIEVYLVHPLRVMINPNWTLQIGVFDSWAIGLVYTKMALSTMRLRPETRIDTALKEMRDNGWRRLNAVTVTLDIIAPVTAGLLGMLLLPILLVLGLQWLLPSKINSNTLFLYVYPGIFISAAFARTYTALQSLLASWAQQIRDSEFLVEMRLRNLEAPPRTRSVSAESIPPLEAQPNSPGAD